MYSLLHYNTFGVDAHCADFKEYASIHELRTILPQLQGRKWLHIGGGSNLLFVGDFDGTILHSAISGMEVIADDGQSVLLKVGAAYKWDDFVADCVERGFYGLENLSYIPGEVGASAVQNIGAYGSEAGHLIEQVETIEVATGDIRVFSHTACEYAYRSSVFKHELRGKYIVTHVVYRLSRTFTPDLEYAAIRHEMEKRGLTDKDMTASCLRQLIIDVRKSKLPEPAELGSAGSFFMNPVVTVQKCEELLRQYPEMPHYIVSGGVKIPAGWMIEQCGWKGRSLGPAGVYAKQALVLVNLGGATGADIARLSEAVQADVMRVFGVEICPEVNFIQ